MFLPCLSRGSEREAYLSTYDVKEVYCNSICKHTKVHDTGVHMHRLSVHPAKEPTLVHIQDKGPSK